MAGDWRYTDTDTGAITTSNHTGPASTSITYCAPICRYCGQSHDEEKCPRVKEIEYRKNGAIKWVRFHAPQPMPYFYHGDTQCDSGSSS